MARGGIGTDQVIVVLGAAVLLLGALSLVALNQGARFGPKQASPAERALAQLSAQLGPNVEVRYIEPGKGRVVCGYGGVKNEGHAVAFVSRPNRMVLSDDPMQKEFKALVQEFCPALPTPVQIAPIPD